VTVGDGAVPDPVPDAESLRAWLTESDFPADADTVLALLVRRGSPSRVLRRLATLPWSVTFADLQDCERSLLRGTAPQRRPVSPLRG
jgi:hypothetical protein